MCSLKTFPRSPGSPCRKVQGQHESASTSQVPDRWLTAGIRTSSNHPRSRRRWPASHRRTGHWVTHHRATRAPAEVPKTSTRAITVIDVVLIAVLVVAIDVEFFRHHFWERSAVNVGIVSVFVALYVRSLKAQ